MLTSVGGHIDQDDDLPGELGQGHVPGPVQQLEAVVVEAALAAAAFRGAEAGGGQEAGQHRQQPRAEQHPDTDWAPGRGDKAVKKCIEIKMYDFERFTFVLMMNDYNLISFFLCNSNGQFSHTIKISHTDSRIPKPSLHLSWPASHLFSRLRKI